MKKTASLLRLFNTFNLDGTKSGKHIVTQFVSLKLKINKYIKNTDIVLIDLNSIDMFLGYNWLVKHDLEIS